MDGLGCGSIGTLLSGVLYRGFIFELREEIYDGNNSSVHRMKKSASLKLKENVIKLTEEINSGGR